jgi:hypothetical protein
MKTIAAKMHGVIGDLETAAASVIDLYYQHSVDPKPPSSGSTFTATSVFAVKRMFVPAVLRLTVGLNGTAAQNRRSHGFERMAPQPGATKL